MTCIRNRTEEGTAPDAALCRSRYRIQAVFHHPAPKLRHSPLNSIMKDRERVDIRFAMCFPDVYEIGMSHLGIQIIYDMLNKFEDQKTEFPINPAPAEYWYSTSHTEE